MSEQRLGRTAQYDGRAEGFERAAEGSPYNAYTDRPAVLELLGDVTELHLLDAGCGPGLYAEELVRCGGHIVGFDQSADMVALARRRVPTGEFRVHDLADPLDWLPDNTFDRALLALVLSHIDDRVDALRELHRVVQPGGCLVVSTTHPATDWQRHGGSYFETTIVEDDWGDGWRIRGWHQPLEAMIDEFLAARFMLDRLVEPRPIPQMADRYPEQYASATTRPVFIAFRLRKPT